VGRNGELKERRRERKGAAGTPFADFGYTPKKNRKQETDQTVLTITKA